MSTNCLFIIHDHTHSDKDWSQHSASAADIDTQSRAWCPENLTSGHQKALVSGAADADLTLQKQSQLLRRLTSPVSQPNEHTTADSNKLMRSALVHEVVTLYTMRLCTEHVSMYRALVLLHNFSWSLFSFYPDYLFISNNQWRWYQLYLFTQLNAAVKQEYVALFDTNCEPMLADDCFQSESTVFQSTWPA